MRELKTHQQTPIINTHYPIQQRGTKRWIHAQTKGPFKHKLDHNNNVEAAYHRIIAKVKAAIAGQGVVYYEKDMKYDKSEGLYSMHSFLTNHFYWRLDCDLCCDYRISYALTDCPYKEAIEKALFAYPLDRAATIRQVEPGLQTFYENVLMIQDKRFHFTS